jgi:hypothetical protein
MNTKSPVKLIKKDDRKDLETQTEVESAVGPNRWSNAVHSWVLESQQRDRNELLPAFDSLFKDALLQSVGAEVERISATTEVKEEFDRLLG